MKFCAVLGKHPKDTPGGAEYQAFLITRELAKRGHEVHYVAHKSDRTTTEIDEGINVHRLNSEKQSEIINKLAQIQADVYYFRIAPDLPLLWRAKGQVDGRFVYNISRNVQCRRRFAPGPRKEADSIIHSIADRIRYGTYRTLLQVPDELFAQTEHQRTLLQENHGLESTLVGNGHPIPETDIQKRSPPIVLWLASLKQVKRPELFIRLAERTQGLPVQFWIVGRPAETDVHEMVQQAVTGQDNLEYLGGTGILESNQYFRKASVYVHTGNSEGFPNTFIQAWLHQTPVISVGTNPDSVLTEQNVGEYHQSIEGAESTLRDYIHNKSTRKNVGQAARNYAEKEHSISAIVDTIETQLTE